MFNRMGFPSCQFEALAEFVNMDWKLYPGVYQRSQVAFTNGTVMNNLVTLNNSNIEINGYFWQFIGE